MPSEGIDFTDELNRAGRVPPLRLGGNSEGFVELMNGGAHKKGFDVSGGLLSHLFGSKEGLKPNKLFKHKAPSSISDLAGAARRRGAATDFANSGPAIASNDAGLDYAKDYMSERNALAALDEVNRGSGSRMDPGHNPDVAIRAGGETLPGALGNSPIGRKMIRDEWDMSSEDSRVLKTLVAAALRGDEGALEALGISSL